MRNIRHNVKDLRLECLRKEAVEGDVEEDEELSRPWAFESCMNIVSRTVCFLIHIYN